MPQYTIDRATARPGQCVLNPADPETWKPCTVTVPAQATHLVGRLPDPLWP